MSGSTRSDRDQVTYKTYDDRDVSREAIRRALRDLEVRRRRRERLAQLRTWAFVALAVLIVLAVAAALIWSNWSHVIAPW
jgi:hypothetical protein